MSLLSTTTKETRFTHTRNEHPYVKPKEEFNQMHRSRKSLEKN
jgi:hypothetical protein